MRPAGRTCRTGVLFAALLAAGFTPPPALAADVRHAAAPADTLPLLPRYLLMDVQGRAVSHEDFRGRFQLVSFGFISCPDVCPTTLLEVRQLLEALGDKAGRVQAIFITVDPERDTREVLRDYTAAFDKRILGLTGSPELVRRAAESFRVQYETVREPGAAADNYTMNHTAGMVLLDPRGRFLARFGYGMGAHAMSERLLAEIAAEQR
ncbi:MAG: SCO family protein [Rhodocyclales bacterium]|nr:SCO family protein [Rhodocyclales bacterium]